MLAASLRSPRSSLTVKRQISAFGQSEKVMKCGLVSLVLLGYTLQRSSATEVQKLNADSHPSWSPAAAAKYLDSRATWWESWPSSQRDHQAVCVSCHTMLLIC